jgi:hypothetical protein
MSTPSDPSFADQDMPPAMGGRGLYEEQYAPARHKAQDSGAVLLVRYIQVR